MYKEIAISKYIINKCGNDEKYISNLPLQKILYFIQKELLKTHGERESIETSLLFSLKGLI